MMFSHFLFGGGGTGTENLDLPSSNFDIAGVPRGSWFSGLFSCFTNVIPSCLFSFCCPCILWAQIVVRAQIPLMIVTKNAFSCMRRRSGYSFFVNSYLVLMALMAISFVIAYFVPNSVWKELFFFVFVFAGIFFIYINGHTRTAFKFKYQIPALLPKGCLFWDCLLDAAISTFCLPCSLAQMARHVFQYDRWNPPIGMFWSDPSSLDALESCPVRPPVSFWPLPPILVIITPFTGEYDNAALTWTNNAPPPGHVANTGAAHRRQQQQQQPHPYQQRGHAGHGTQAPVNATAAAVLYQPQTPSAPPTSVANPVAYASGPSTAGGPVYRADGSVVQ